MGKTPEPTMFVNKIIMVFALLMSVNANALELLDYRQYNPGSYQGIIPVSFDIKYNQAVSVTVTGAETVVDYKLVQTERGVNILLDDVTTAHDTGINVDVGIDNKSSQRSYLVYADVGHFYQAGLKLTPPVIPIQTAKIDPAKDVEVTPTIPKPPAQRAMQYLSVEDQLNAEIGRIKNEPRTKANSAAVEQEHKKIVNEQTTETKSPQSNTEAVTVAKPTKIRTVKYQTTKKKELPAATTTISKENNPAKPVKLAQPLVVKPEVATENEQEVKAKVATEVALQQAIGKANQEWLALEQSAQPQPEKIYADWIPKIRPWTATMVEIFGPARETNTTEGVNQ